MKTAIEFLAVAVGGSLGAMARYGLARLVDAIWRTQFPVATWLANLLGCFLIGLLLGSGHSDRLPTLRLFFGVGFLGALTTFSTFGAETIQHAQQGNYGIAVGNIGLNLVTGLTAVAMGIAIGRRLWG